MQASKLTILPTTYSHFDLLIWKFRLTKSTLLLPFLLFQVLKYIRRMLENKAVVNVKKSEAFKQISNIVKLETKANW